MAQRKPCPIERRPKLLKDFLNDNSNSCSSSGFKSFPRHQSHCSKVQSYPNPYKYPETSQPAISAFRALIKAAVKKIHFTAVKSPSFLPRSLSRGLSRRGSKSTRENREAKTSVRVKDILRWTSFRGVAEERSQPSDLSTTPNHDAFTNDSSSNSTNGSSFSSCESDFTAEFLPLWCGNSHEKELEMDEKKLPCNVGVEDYVHATIDTARDPQDGEIVLYEEDEQKSPISVFDFEFRETEEPLSTSFDQSLANVERTRQQLLQKIKEFQNLSNFERVINTNYKEEDEEDEEEEEEEEYGVVEESAREMLVYLKATSSTKMSRVEEELIFDFFRDELESRENGQCSKLGVCNWDMVTLAKSWMSGESNAFCYGIENYNREAYIRDMNRVGNWSKFEVEQENLALEIGEGILGQLIEELLVDLSVK